MQRRLGIGDDGHVGALEILLRQQFAHAEVDDVAVVDIGDALLVGADGLYTQQYVVALLYLVLEVVPLDDGIVIVGDETIDRLSLHDLLAVGVGMSVEQLHLVVELMAVVVLSRTADMLHEDPPHDDVGREEPLASPSFLAERRCGYLRVLIGVERLVADLCTVAALTEHEAALVIVILLFFIIVLLLVVVHNIIIFSFHLRHVDFQSEEKQVAPAAVLNRCPVDERAVAVVVVGGDAGHIGAVGEETCIDKSFAQGEHRRQQVVGCLVDLGVVVDGIVGLLVGQQFNNA